MEFSWQDPKLFSAFLGAAVGIFVGWFIFSKNDKNPTTKT